MTGRTSRSAQFALNAGASYLRFGMNMVIMLALTPFMVGRLGAQDFGLWSLVFAVLGFVALMDCGFATSTVKYVAECRGAGDFERRNRMVSTLAVVYLGLGLVGAICIALLAAFFNRVFAIPAEQHARALAILWILGFRNVILALPLGLFQGVLFGDQKIWVVNIIQIVGNALYAVLTVLTLSAGGGVVALAWANLAAMLAEYAAYVVLAFLLVPGLRVSPRLADRSLLGEMTSFSLSQLVVNVAALVRLRTDPVILKLFLPLSAVAAYTVALRIAEAVYLLTKQGVNAMSPVVAMLKGEGDEQKIRFVLLNAAKFAFVGACLPAAAAASFSRDLLTLWVGPAYAWAAPTMALLVTAMWLSVPQMVAAIVLVMGGHHAFSARAQVVGMVLNVGFSLLLVRPLGMAGVAAGTLLATIIGDLLYATGHACRVHSVTGVQYLRRVIVPGVAAALVQAAVSLTLRAAMPPHRLWEVALLALPGMGAALAVLWLGFTDPSEKHLVVTRILRRRAAPAEPHAAPEG